MPRIGKYPDRFRQLPEHDGRFDAYRLSADGVEVLFASYPADTSIPPHCHDTDNYGVITRGELILTLDGQTHRYGPGDWYHVPANAQHSARFETDTDEIEFWFREEPAAA
ncbi:MAG: cupin domain-containing protein [Xanthomonadales bacterium]|nr:cupin domain-containing protein [Xanthomonadales bacterium]